MSESWISPELADQFEAERLFEQLDALEGDVYRQVAGRRTVRVLLGGRPCFLKIHHGVGWMEIFKNLLQFRLPVLGARNELMAIRALERAGVPTMRPVLFVEQGANPATRRSAIVTESLEDRTSLEDHVPADVTEKRRLLETVACMARDMHTAGINHRDFYLCHFLMANDNHDDLRLIDLHRAQLRTRVPGRWLVKDLGALLFSAFDKGLTRRDLLRFVRTYYPGLTLRQALEKQGFWAAVRGRARRLYLQDHDALTSEIRDLLGG